MVENLVVEARVAALRERCSAAEVLVMDAEVLMSRPSSVGSEEWRGWRTRALAHIQAAKVTKKPFATLRAGALDTGSMNSNYWAR